MRTTNFNTNATTMNNINTILFNYKRVVAQPFSEHDSHIIFCYDMYYELPGGKLLYLEPVFLNKECSLKELCDVLNRAVKRELDKLVEWNDDITYTALYKERHKTVKAYKLYKLSDEPTEFMEWDTVAVIPVFGAADF